MLTPGIAEERSTNSNYVLTAVNSNPKYLRFLNEWIDAWRAFGRLLDTEVNPIVVLVDVEIETVSARSRHYVTHIESPPGIHSALVAQVVRLFSPGHLTLGSSIIMTSDIDMFPVGPKFFNLIFGLAAGGFVVGRDVSSEIGEFPMCYLAAPSREWENAFCVGRSTYEDLESIDAVPYSGVHGGVGWNTDQLIAYQKLAGNQRIQRLSDRNTGHRRLDRAEGIRALLRSLSSSVIHTHSDYHAHNSPVGGRIVSSAILRHLRRHHRKLSEA